MLTSLAKPGFFPGAELGTTWAKLADVWAHHPELLDTWRPVHVMAGKAILEAWAANPPTNGDPEPDFIKKLKARRNKARNAAASVKEWTDVERDAATVSLNEWNDTDLVIDAGAGGDWVFWDQFFLNAEMSQGYVAVEAMMPQ